MYAFNRLLTCKFEVREWVVKRRIFDPFSEFSGWGEFLPDSSMHIHILRTVLAWASVMVSPLTCSGRYDL